MTSEKVAGVDSRCPHCGRPVHREVVFVEQDQIDSLEDALKDLRSKYDLLCRQNLMIEEARKRDRENGIADLTREQLVEQLELAREYEEIIKNRAHATMLQFEKAMNTIQEVALHHKDSTTRIWATKAYREIKGIK